MYRHAFGRPYMRQPEVWTTVSATGPQLSDHEGWADAVNASLALDSPSQTAPRTAARFPPAFGESDLGGHLRSDSFAEKAPLRPSINWMPATRYQDHWRSMRAFALPSFYDGRIRINLASRERNGSVRLAQYKTVCDEIEAVLRECRDPATGKGVVDYIERTGDSDPLTMGPTESDLVVVWAGMACAFDHPRLGRLGPVPFRRPGGHTGQFGMAYVCNSEMAAGDRGVRSSFDIVPTLVELLGEPVPPGLSGASLLGATAVT